MSRGCRANRESDHLTVNSRMLPKHPVCYQPRWQFSHLQHLQSVPQAQFPAVQVQQEQAPSQTETVFGMLIAVVFWFVFFIFIIPLFIKNIAGFSRQNQCRACTRLQSQALFFIFFRRRFFATNYTNGTNKK